MNRHVSALYCPFSSFLLTFFFLEEEKKTFSYRRLYFVIYPNWDLKIFLALMQLNNVLEILGDLVLYRWIKVNLLWLIGFRESLPPIPIVRIFKPLFSFYSYWPIKFCWFFPVQLKLHYLDRLLIYFDHSSGNLDLFKCWTLQI